MKENARNTSNKKSVCTDTDPGTGAVKGPDTDTGSWYVYMLRCSDHSLYTGITNNLGRRLNEHNAGGTHGARYTRSRRPVQLAYVEDADDRRAACQRESALKRLTKARKESLIEAGDQSADPNAGQLAEQQQ